MKKKKADNDDHSEKSDPGWIDLKDFIQRKKNQNKALKKIIDKINDKENNKK